jgi:hypothetical protein
MAAIIQALIAKKAQGAVVGLLASKTQYAATLGSSSGLYALIPGVLAKDPEAIGNAVLILLCWIGTLIGRLRA